MSDNHYQESVFFAVDFELDLEYIWIESVVDEEGSSF